MEPLQKVDPTAKHSFGQKLVRGLIGTGAGTTMARVVSARLDPILLKSTNGRVQTGVGFPCVNVRTIGRKSGKPRTATLVYFNQGDDVVLIASSFGRDAHPAWYLNLKDNPRAELLRNGRGGTYIAHEVEGEERDRLYDLATSLYAGYDTYAQKTDRTIPVMVLSPAGE